MSSCRIPDAVDWDGDKAAESDDEWIENHQPGGCHDGSWRLEAGRHRRMEEVSRITLPVRHVVGARRIPGAVFGTQTRMALNNDADSVRLVAPDGREVDSYAYSSSKPNRSYSRMVDGTARGPTAILLRRAAPTCPPPRRRPQLRHQPARPPPSHTDPTRTPTATATVTPTPTPLPVVRLNEFLAYPDTVDWDGNGTIDAYDEWIELVSLAAVAVDLGGWMLDDIADGGSQPYAFARARCCRRADSWCTIARPQGWR